MSTHPMTAEESLVQQASAIRRANKDLMPDQKIFVYRDPVIAYPWCAPLLTRSNFCTSSPVWSRSGSLRAGFLRCAKLWTTRGSIPGF